MLEIHKKRILKLVNALESGEYKQVHYSLKCGEGFCCLGVATELYRKDTGEGRWDSKDDWIDRDERGCYTLPHKVVEYYGLNSVDPIITIQKVQGSAALFNDDGCSFSEIADGFRTLVK